MDPNVLLTELRAALADWGVVRDGDSSDAEADRADDIVRRVRDLDEWLSKGGFLPAEWSRHDSD